jgi:hypothetical protein
MLRDVLNRYCKGEIPLDEAEKLIAGLRLETVSNLAHLDLGRPMRCGIPEVILAEGKDPAQLKRIAKMAVDTTGRCIISRITPEHRRAIQELEGQTGVSVTFHDMAHMAVISRVAAPERTGGVVAVITAGTSDIAVAEEARVIAEEMGCRVCSAYDVGAAGIHRLFPALRTCIDAHVFIVAAGREGTLPAIVAGLVNRPVIGVPVSTGYGYMGHGKAALASMLQSCSVLAVVNIDSGFTAGAFAAQIANMVAER